MSVELMINKGVSFKGLTSLSNHTLQVLGEEIRANVDLTGFGGTLDPQAILQLLYSQPTLFHSQLTSALREISMVALSNKTNIVYFT